MAMQTLSTNMYRVGHSARGRPRPQAGPGWNPIIVAVVPSAEQATEGLLRSWLFTLPPILCCDFQQLAGGVLSA